MEKRRVNTLRNVVLGLIVGLLMAPWGEAQAQGKLGIVSMVGAEFAITLQQDGVGSNINKDVRNMVPSAEVANVVLRGAKSAAEASGQKGVVTFSLRGDTPRELTDLTASGKRLMNRFGEQLADLAKDEKISQFVIVANARYPDWTSSKNSAAGIGMYYPRGTKDPEYVTFAYLQLLLIDVASMQVTKAVAVKNHKRHEGTQDPPGSNRFVPDTVEVSGVNLTKTLDEGLSRGIAELLGKN
jgi:hypothetical protein